MRQFFGVKSIAKNLSNGDKGNYTLEIFKSMFPEFTKMVGETKTFVVDDSIVQSFIDIANDVISPSRYGAMWKLCCGWYIAHRLTLYLKTYSDNSNGSIASIVGKATPKGNVASSTLGDASISYDNKSTSENDIKWGELNQTLYGTQLIAQARLIGMGGSYVI